MERVLEGKKLLILGGGADMISVTNLAKDLGCTVYVTDFYDTLRSPAKLVADYSADISLADYDAVVDYIKENAIDGVITGYTDSYLDHYLNICEKANLPHYGSRQSFGIGADKMLFKNACIAAGVGVIPGCHAYDFETVEVFAAKNGYPLMLKPTDNSGSRGVIKCETADELRRCYEYALSFSKSRNVIVEKYMDCDSVVCSYQLAGEDAYLSAFCDRDIYKSESNGSAFTIEARYPSSYLERYISEEHPNMLRLFKENGFKEGMVGVMGYVDDGGFYWCEMTYRPSGGHHYTLINDQNGINGLALMIEYAVTGRTDSYDPSKENAHFTEYCGMIHIPGVPEGLIHKILGLDEIEKLPYVIEVCQELRPGQTIGREGTTAQTVVSVWLKGKDYDDYKKNVQTVKQMLKVEDVCGKSLLMSDIAG